MWFSFRQTTVDEQFIKSEKIKKIQKVYKGFIFRKKFIKENRKDLLIKESDEYINNKKKEYISKNLMEIDTIIKKEFNDNFLDKLQIKENTQKKKYLIKKNSKNEELFLYIGELDLYNGINGYGELYLKNGKKYEGIFINGKLNGYGRLIDSLKMRCYEGNFKDNELLDGKGRIIDIKDDGSKIVYEGDININNTTIGVYLNFYFSMGRFWFYDNYFYLLCCCREIDTPKGNQHNCKYEQHPADSFDSEFASCPL